MRGRGQEPRTVDGFQKLAQARKQILSQNLLKEPTLHTLLQFLSHILDFFQNCKRRTLCCYQPRGLQQFVPTAHGKRIQSVSNNLPDITSYTVMKLGRKPGLENSKTQVVFQSLCFLLRNAFSICSAYCFQERVQQSPSLLSCLRHKYTCVVMEITSDIRC